ncbi:hypothetical protein [Streptomyces kurssanovii]|uniref:Uncharacterized protein n=1 Tax=Streptomyces kurssanovii TaxID=67312 RepID=A0ABV3HVC8_9ACTN
MDTRADTERSTGRIPEKERIRTCRPAVLPGRESDGQGESDPETNIFRGED